jgi:hypothetical protein
VQELRRLQAENRDPEQSIKGKPHGEIGISADACRNGALPAGRILTSTYLLVNPADGYLPVLEDIDLRQEISQTDLAGKLPACPAG